MVDCLFNWKSAGDGYGFSDYSGKLLAMCFRSSLLIPPTQSCECLQGFSGRSTSHLKHDYLAFKYRASECGEIRLSTGFL